MPYSAPVNWQNAPSTATPVSADNLNKMEDQIEALSTALEPSGANATLNGSLTVATNAQVNGQAWSTLHALTDGATISVNCDNANVFSVTLGGNRTLAAPTNMKAGSTYVFMVRQDATGNRILSFSATYKFPGGIDPILSTNANAVDILSFVSDGTSMFGSVLTNFS